MNTISVLLSPALFLPLVNTLVICKLDDDAVVLVPVGCATDIAEETSPVGSIVLVGSEDVGTRVSAEAEKERRSEVDCAGELADDMGIVGSAAAVGDMRPRMDSKTLRRGDCLRIMYMDEVSA